MNDVIKISQRFHLDYYLYKTYYMGEGLEFIYLKFQQHNKVNIYFIFVLFFLIFYNCPL